MNKTFKTFLTLSPMLVIVLVLMLFVSHVNFQKHVSGWMTTSSAHKLGLVQDEGNTPFSPKRVWFAKEVDGYEFRSAYPFIGSVPFDFFGSGKTTKDLLIECDRLGQQACVKIK